MEEKKEGVGFGIAGFVLGLLSVLLFWVWFLSPILGILGLIFSIIQLKNHKTGLAIAGLVLSIIGILILVAFLVFAIFFWITVIPGIQDDLSEVSLCLDASSQIMIRDVGNTCIASNGNLNVEISRAAEDFDLAEIQIIVTGDGDSNSQTISSGLPRPNENVIITLDDQDYSYADKVQLAPTILTSQGPWGCEVSAPIQITKC